MTHASAAGSPLEVPADGVRLSVGIENAEDLLADLEAGRPHGRTTVPRASHAPGQANSGRPGAGPRCATTPWHHTRDRRRYPSCDGERPSEEMKNVRTISLSRQAAVAAVAA